VSCTACDENGAAERGEDPYAVAELASGFVRLNPTQYHRGATFFVARRCVVELHELEGDERIEHLLDLAAVTEAVHRCVEPRKLNCEALGNSVPHLHWWITPRHHDDPRPGGPIWEDLEFLRAQWTGGARLDVAERDLLRTELLVALRPTGREVRRDLTGAS
jgi:diadenosine tetraphosphate (Ap4A) HIT family hydrolase